MAVAEGVRLYVLNANTSRSYAKNRRMGRSLSRNPHRAALLGGRRHRKGRGGTRAIRATDAEIVIGRGIGTGIGREGGIGIVSPSGRGTEIGTGTAGIGLGKENVRLDKTLVAVADDEEAL